MFRKPIALVFCAGALFGQQAPAFPTFSRWVSVEQASTASRYLWVHGTGGETNASQIQHQEEFRGRFHVVPGRLSVVAGVASGNHFTVGWNNTGAGLGSAQSTLYLKHLFLSAKPVDSLELQFGSFGVERGMSTDITSYHGQAFMTGQRAILSNPRKVWFDRIAVTYGFMGDFDRPGINKRFGRFDDGNYGQLLVSKTLNSQVSISADVTSHAGVRTLRQGVAVKVPRIVNDARFELYQRLGNRAAGLHAGVSRSIGRFRLEGGYMSIDKDFGRLNNDIFFSGNRVYAGPSFRIAHGLSFFSLFHRAVGTNYSVSNRSFMHIGMQYDVLAAWRGAEAN